MKTNRYTLIVLGMLLSPVVAMASQVSVGVRLSNVSIGVNLQSYPDLVVVPGYPVYYAPQLDTNFFFYDGMYWIYQDDNWYASSWYNGPWWLVYPEDVPVFILRVPVRYYRRPPVYFYGWRPDAPPRWGDHWGRDWEEHRNGWDRWNHNAVPAPAPLPVYQRQYSGDRYPQHIQQQQQLQQQHYGYQPHEPAVQRHYQQIEQRNSPVQQRAPEQKQRNAPEVNDVHQQQNQRVTPYQPAQPVAPHVVVPQQGGENRSKVVPYQQQQHPQNQDRGQPVQPRPEQNGQHEQQMQKSQGKAERQQGKEVPHESKPQQQQQQQQQQQRNRDHYE
ncbi:MAG: hypothetical protein P4L77_13175 [Sulfuriferula sp.]|nr:hypothetical protein [Sulfuriferula sp.]